MYLRSHAIADTGVHLILGNWQIWKSSSLMSSNNNAIVAIQVVDEEEAEEALRVASGEGQRGARALSDARN